MKWYQKILPTIQDVEPYVIEVSRSISKIAGVKSVYAWGPYAENIKNKHYHIREIDLIADSKFHSGDLIAIDENDPLSPLSISNEDLQDLGFNPNAVKFTKEIIKLQQSDINLWCKSKDNKLLHWGIVPDTVEEWKELRAQAEEHAENITSVSRKSLKNASANVRKEWKEAYDETIQQFMDGSPIGWYQSSISTDDILNEAIKIV
jgi:hypothetical protein